MGVNPPDEFSSSRSRYELRLSDSKRDRRLATWIDWQINEGRDASEMLKNILDEIITGKSAITGRPITYQGEVGPLLPDASDPVTEALAAFED